MASASNGATVQFTPVNTGDMQEIPPDLPAGEWEATCSVKKLKTAKDGYPMLCLEWRTTEALTEGNEDYVGAKASDFVVFWPSSAPASRMSKIRLKAMCTALNIGVPTTTKLKDWEDITDFLGELEGLKGTIYTSVDTRKDTGEQVTKISYNPPGSSLKMKAAAAGADDEDDEPAPKKKVAAPAKKIARR